MRLFIRTLVLFSVFILSRSMNILSSGFYERNCGMRSKQCLETAFQVSGGIEACAAKAPWNIIIQNRLFKKRKRRQADDDDDDDLINVNCGGSLVTEKHAVTAAHCFMRNNFRGSTCPKPFRSCAKDSRKCPTPCIRTQPSDVTVYVGKTIRKNKNPLSVTKIKIHPEWERGLQGDKTEQELSYQGVDIAVLELEKYVPLDFASVWPVCLPVREDILMYDPGETVYLYGFGNVKGPSSSPKVLQVGTLEIRKSSFCSTHYEGKSFEKLVCALGDELSNKRQTGSCSGDSGGGAVSQRRSSQNFVLLSVVSFGGQDCGKEKRKPSVMTNVLNNADWIRKIISKWDKKTQNTNSTECDVSLFELDQLKQLKVSLEEKLSNTSQSQQDMPIWSPAQEVQVPAEDTDCKLNLETIVQNQGSLPLNTGPVIRAYKGRLRPIISKTDRILKLLGESEDINPFIAFNLTLDELTYMATKNNLWEKNANDEDIKERLKSINTIPFENIKSGVFTVMALFNKTLGNQDTMYSKTKTSFEFLLCKNKDINPDLEDDISEGVEEFSQTEISDVLNNIYKENCSSSLKPLYNAIRLLVQIKTLYLLLKVNFYNSIKQNVLEANPNMNPVSKTWEDIEIYVDDVKVIGDAASDALGGFFWAALASNPSWNLNLRYIPDFPAIEKTQSNFLKESTIGLTIYGDSNGSQNKISIYRNPAEPRFVRVENAGDGHEYIFAYDDQTELLQEGIYRYKFPDGGSVLGFRLIKRGERKENKVNMLDKTNDGKIYYNDKMAENGWKTLVKKKFEPDTLTWTNQYNF